MEARERQEAIRDLVRTHLQESPRSAYKEVLEEVERVLLVEALRITQGNLARAALHLGLSRPTVREKIRKYGIGRTVQIKPAPPGRADP